MALAQISSYKHTGRNRSAVITFALVALAMAFVIIGNITAAGPAVYRAHSVIAEAR
jgi:ribonuclease PH